MAATASIDAIEWLRKQVEGAPDALRTMLTEMVNVLMAARQLLPREAARAPPAR